MKKLFGFIAACLLTIGVSAQTATVNGDAESMKRSVSEGVFEFTLPETANEEDVSRTANYYTDYFTVDYNHDSKKATITMVDNDAMTRRIITRFLLSNDVKLIDFDGKNYTINEFYEKHMIQ